MKGIIIKKKSSLVVKSTRPVIIAGRKDKIKGKMKKNSTKKCWVTTYLNYYLYQHSKEVFFFNFIINFLILTYLILNLFL